MGLNSDRPKLFCKIEDIPGDKVIDFQPFGSDHILFLTDDGYLSLYSFSLECSKVAAVKRIYLKEKEKTNSLAVCQNSKRLFISLLREKDDVILQNQTQSNNYRMIQTSLVDVLCFKIEDKGSKMRFSPQFNKAFKVLSKVEESPFFIHLTTQYDKQGNLLLVMIFSKQQSEVHIFKVENEESSKGLSLLHNFKTRSRVVAYEFLEDQSLWLFDKQGIIKSYN